LEDLLMDPRTHDQPRFDMSRFHIKTVVRGDALERAKARQDRFVAAVPTRTCRPALTVDQAAVRASVSRRTIYVWLSAGKFTYLRTPTGRIRIDVDSFDAFRLKRTGA
jgi:excisionase family DNA binding protein